MISAGSAVSDSSTAPSTDCSASRFCGGVTGPSKPREWPLAGLRSVALIGPTESRSRLRPSSAELPCSLRRVLSESSRMSDQRVRAAFPIVYCEDLPRDARASTATCSASR